MIRIFDPISDFSKETHPEGRKELQKTTAGEAY